MLFKLVALVNLVRKLVTLFAKVTLLSYVSDVSYFS